jgi:hypothetical protein
MLLTYSAAHDPFHAVFRMLSILEATKATTFVLDRLLILDFFVCFPWAADIVSGSRKVPGFIVAQNRVIKAFRRNGYEQIPEPRVMFKRMRPSQLAAINSLASYGYIDNDKFEKNLISVTTKSLPPSLAGEIDDYLKANSILFEFLLVLGKLPMSSSDGLKAKTGLEEYKYDYV